MAVRSARMETVSVVIPTYNAASFLEQAVDSALAQTYGAVEVIVVDDGSTDHTAEVLGRYANRLRVLQQANQGAAAACNAGVEAAAGGWIAFLDADDEWLPAKLERQLNRCGDFAISHTDSVCFGDSIEGEVLRSSFEPQYGGKVLGQLLVRNFITKSSVLMRRDVFRSYGGFAARYHGVEDWPFWLKVCKDHELGYLPESVVRYHVRRSSKSTESRKTLVDHIRIIEEAFAPGGPGELFPGLRGAALVSSYEINGHFAARSGDWPFALRCALAGLRHAPITPRLWKSLVKSILMPLGFRY